MLLPMLNLLEVKHPCYKHVGHLKNINLMPSLLTAENIVAFLIQGSLSKGSDLHST